MEDPVWESQLMLCQLPVELETTKIVNFRLHIRICHMQDAWKAMRYYNKYCSCQYSRYVKLAMNLALSEARINSNAQVT